MTKLLQYTRHDGVAIYPAALLVTVGLSITCVALGLRNIQTLISRSRLLDLDLCMCTTIPVPA